MKPLAAAFPKKDEAGLDFDTIMLDLKILSKRLSTRQNVRVLRRPVIRPDVQLLRLAIVAEGGD